MGKSWADDAAVVAIAGLAAVFGGSVVGCGGQATFDNAPGGVEESPAATGGRDDSGPANGGLANGGSGGLALGGGAFGGGASVGGSPVIVIGGAPGVAAAGGQIGALPEDPSVCRCSIESCGEGCFPACPRTQLSCARYYPLEGCSCDPALAADVKCPAGEALECSTYNPNAGCRCVPESDALEQTRLQRSGFPAAIYSKEQPIIPLGVREVPPLLPPWVDPKAPRPSLQSCPAPNIAVRAPNPDACTCEAAGDIPVFGVLESRGVGYAGCAAATLAASQRERPEGYCATPLSVANESQWDTCQWFPTSLLPRGWALQYCDVSSCRSHVLK